MLDDLETSMQELNAMIELYTSRLEIYHKNYIKLIKEDYQTTALDDVALVKMSQLGKKSEEILYKLYYIISDFESEPSKALAWRKTSRENKARIQHKKIEPEPKYGLEDFLNFAKN